MAIRPRTKRLAMPRFSPTDFANLIPEPESSLRALQSTAPEFTRCPRGHKLPHRVDSGLCWADHCADDGSPRVDAPDDRTADLNKAVADEMDLLPRGLEARAVSRSFNGVEDAARYTGQREEALAIARAYGMEQARSLIHQLPGIPSPPRGVTGDEYYEQRLEQIGPYVLEKMIFLAQFGTPEQQKHYVDELAERYKSKKREISPRGTLPFALVVQQGGPSGSSKVGVFFNPYDQQLQKALPPPEVKGVVAHEPQEIRSEPAPSAVFQGNHDRRALDPGASNVHAGSGQDPDSGGAVSSDLERRPTEDDLGSMGGQVGDGEDPLEGIPPFWSEQS